MPSPATSPGVTLGYIISAYSRPRQLVRLVSRLEGPGRRFCVHVDRNAPRSVHEATARALGGRDDVRVLPSHRCQWGDFGHVRATLKGLEALVAAGLPDYVILLTGQDYPIKPAGEIDRWFAAHRGQSFMNHQPLPVEPLPEGGFDRIDRWHFWSRGRHRVFRADLGPARRRLPCGLRPYFGSGYWCLHRRAVEHVVDFTRDNPRYVRFFAHAFIPDELFFQTILMGSPLRETIVDDDLRLIHWPGPKVLTVDDWDAIRTSADLFARKFDAEIDPVILDRIDQELLA